MQARAARFEAPYFPRWLVLFQGVAAIVLGLLLLTVPAQATFVLVQLLGIYWLVTGTLSLASIFIDRSNWGWKAISGVLGIIAGILIIQHPIMSTILVPATIVMVLGFQGLIIGGIDLFHGFQERRWGPSLLGALSIAFGLVLLASPFVAAMFLPFTLGILALAGGAVAVMLALQERPARREEEMGPGRMREAA